MEGTPLHHSEILELDATDTSSSTELQVPDGKWWVIEYVSASIMVAQGDRFRPFEIWTSAPKLGGGTSRPHHYLNPQPVPRSDNRYCVSQPTTLYAMPGSQVHVRFDRNAPHGNASVRFTISGRAVDA